MFLTISSFVTYKCHSYDFKVDTMIQHYVNMKTLTQEH